jgi:hypothetical protein
MAASEIEQDASIFGKQNECLPPLTGGRYNARLVIPEPR